MYIIFVVNYFKIYILNFNEYIFNYIILENHHNENKPKIPIKRKRLVKVRVMKLKKYQIDKIILEQRNNKIANLPKIPKKIEKKPTLRPNTFLTAKDLKIRKPTNGVENKKEMNLEDHINSIVKDIFPRTNSVMIRKKHPISALRRNSLSLTMKRSDNNTESVFQNKSKENLIDSRDKIREILKLPEKTYEIKPTPKADLPTPSSPGKIVKRRATIIASNPDRIPLPLLKPNLDLVPKPATPLKVLTPQDLNETYCSNLEPTPEKKTDFSYIFENSTNNVDKVASPQKVMNIFFIFNF